MFLEVRDFMNSDHDVYDPQPQDGSLEIGICYKGENLGILVGEIIRVPEAQPWQPEKKYPDLDGEENIDDSKDAGHDWGTSAESVSSVQFL
jgi:hypothetical protein